MRFLADMGISARVVDWLRDQGHDATHLSEERMHRLADRDVFAKAAAEDRLLLTFDLDFGEIAACSSEHSLGVVLFRLHNTRAEHVLERLSAVLTDFASELDEGAVILVEESRVRIRTRPSQGGTGQEQ